MVKKGRWREAQERALERATERNIGTPPPLPQKWEFPFLGKPCHACGAPLDAFGACTSGELPECRTRLP